VKKEKCKELLRLFGGLVRRLFGGCAFGAKQKSNGKMKTDSDWVLLFVVSLPFDFFFFLFPS
jgi:hypothetical protein